METIDCLLNHMIEERVRAVMDEFISNQSQSVKDAPRYEKPLYTNKEMMEMLDVDPKTLKSYRDEGLLPFTMHGSKYFYSLDDVKKFLEAGHHEAYALC